jgi:hypothetical protein
MTKLNLMIAGMMVLSLNAFAGGGVVDSGGGNAVGAQLLDLYENEGTEIINPTETEAYKQVLVPIFKNLNSKVKFLSDMVMKPSITKTWILDSKTLTDEACINHSMFTAQKQIVACQDNVEVRIEAKWFDKKADLKNQAALLVHEFLRGVALTNPKMNDQSVKFLTRLFMSAESVTEQQLVNGLINAGMIADGKDDVIAGTTWNKYIVGTISSVFIWNCQIDADGNAKRLNKAYWYNDIFDVQRNDLGHAFNRYVRNLHNGFKVQAMSCPMIKREMER